ncbi:MAG: efflux RND transporter periplasmic adaptor subunit [Gammaproteobacteria bacterium]
MKPNDLDGLRIERDDRRFAQAPRRSFGRVLLIAAMALGIALAYLYVGGGWRRGTEVEVSKVVLAYPSQAYALLNATGYVVPQTKADVASKATGRLEWIGVEEGTRVTQGQIIARLENQDVVATMEQAAANITVAKARSEEAQADLNEASLTLKRAQDLLAKKYVSKEDYDAAVARHDKAAAAARRARSEIRAAEAYHAGAKVAVQYTLIRAPFDGVVLSKHADIGDIVAPFSSTTESKGSVVSMADLDTLEVEADVSESNIATVAVDQPCEVLLDALPQSRFRCVVSRIVPTVDRSKATVLVKVKFVDRDPRILPDMSAKVAFLSQALSRDEQSPRLVTQPEAIVERDGQKHAFVVDGSQVREVTVEVGARLGERVVVSRGLKEGDKVVLRPPDTLADGGKIWLKEP